MGVLNGVAVGPSGTIYVTGDAANALYAIASRTEVAVATLGTPERATPVP
jgi:hypothetical protein